MKNCSMKKGIMALTVFALVGAISLGNSGTSRAMQRDGMFPGSGGPAMMRGLDLSDSQKEQIREIFKGLREKGKEEGRAFRDSIRDYESDLTAEEAAGIKSKMAEMTYKGMQTQYQVFQVLTPEQRQKLEEKRTENQDDRKDIRENRRNRFNQELTRELDLTSSQQAKLQKMNFDRDRKDGISDLEEKLDLTFSQKEKIISIVEKHRDADRNQRQGREKMKELHDLVSAATFDETKAREMASSMAEDMVSRISERKALNAEIMEVLNEDQKEQFQDMRYNLWDREPHHGGFQGHPGRR